MEIMESATVAQLFENAKTLLFNDDIDTALDTIEIAIENYPNEAEGYFLRAEAYLKKGMSAKTIEYLQQANLLDAQNITYHGRLAEQLFLIEKIDQAIEHYQSALTIDANLDWAYVGLGNAFEKKGYLDKAIEYFQQAVAMNNKSIELHARLAQLQARYDDTHPEKLKTIAKKKQKISLIKNYAPSDLSHSTTNYAGLVDGIHDNILSGWALNKAELTACQRLELLIADNVVATFMTHTSRAAISTVVGTETPYGFELSLSELLKTNASFKPLINTLESNKVVECKVRFSETNLFLKFAGDNSINLLNLLGDTSSKELDKANHARHKGNYKEALTLYLDYLNDYPLNWSIYHQVADVYLYLKKYDEAILYYAEALSINPDYSWSLHNLSLAYYLSGNWADALVNYQHLRKAEPAFWHEHQDDYTVQKHLAYMLLHSNEEKQARKLFTSLVLEQTQAWDCYLDLTITTRETASSQPIVSPVVTRISPEMATIDDVLHSRIALRDFLFPSHSIQWRNLIAKAPISSAPCEQAKAFLEAISVCKLTKEAIVVGWIVHTPDSVLWLEDNTGNYYPLENICRSFRQDVYDLFVHEFGSTASNASMIARVKGIKVGSIIKLKTYSAAGVHILHETSASELPVNPIAAARWLFSITIPIAEFHRRVSLIDQPILEPLIQQYTEIQKTLAVQITSCGESIAKPVVSVIVPLYGRTDFVEHQLLEFINDPWLLQHGELIYVVDDPRLIEGFTTLAQTLYALYRVPFRWLWGNSNRGFSGANNLGAEYANGDYFVFLNSDVFPQQAGWLLALITVLKEHTDIGAVAPRLVFADGSIQHAGMVFARHEELGVWINHHPYLGLDPCLDPAKELTRVPSITGACLAIRREDFASIGGWDNGYLIGDFEDSDLCLKLKTKGFSIAYLPTVQLNHLERQSFKIQDADDFRIRLVLYNAVRHQNRWATLLKVVTDID